MPHYWLAAAKAKGAIKDNCVCPLIQRRIKYVKATTPN